MSNSQCHFTNVTAAHPKGIAAEHRLQLMTNAGCRELQCAVAVLFNE